MLEYLIKTIRLYLLKRKTIKTLNQGGYVVTNFEWITEPPKDDKCRVYPLDDGFDHEAGGDTCMCRPRVGKLLLEDGRTQVVIYHHYMEAQH